MEERCQCRSYGEGTAHFPSGTATDGAITAAAIMAAVALPRRRAVEAGIMVAAGAVAAIMVAAVVPVVVAMVAEEDRVGAGTAVVPVLSAGATQAVASVEAAMVEADTAGAVITEES